jgi:hemoglobin/transferrin/lactoferrin receptor protein
MNVLQILPAATHATNGAHVQTNWLFGRHHVLAGLDAWQKDMDSFRERIIRVDVLGADNAVVNSIDQVVGERPIPLSSYRSTGLFVQDEIPFWNNRLTMTVGGRYDIIQVENEQAMQPVYMIVDGVKNDTPAGQFTMWEAQSAQDNSWSGNLGLLFKATDKTDLTLTVARSFRSPYLEERYQYIDLGSVIKVGDPDLNPEQGAFADVGVRYWGDRFHFSSSVFYNQIKDMVVEEAGEYEGRAAFLKTNIDSAELYGADMSLSVRLTSSLSLFGAAAYVHGADTYLDEPLPLIPPLNGRVGLRGPLSRFFEFECAARMYGTQDRVASWEKETAGYTVFDFYLNSKMFTLGSLSNQIFFGFENIFDRSYRDHLSTNRGAIAIEPGRNISLRWRLGI